MPAETPALPPAPPQIHIPQPDTVSQVTTDSNQAGNAFGRNPSQSNATVSNVRVSAVSIAGRPYTGAIYDAHDRRLN